MERSLLSVYVCFTRGNSDGEIDLFLKHNKYKVSCHKGVLLPSCGIFNIEAVFKRFYFLHMNYWSENEISSYQFTKNNSSSETSLLQVPKQWWSHDGLCSSFCMKNWKNSTFGAFGVDRQKLKWVQGPRVAPRPQVDLQGVWVLCWFRFIRTTFKLVVYNGFNSCFGLSCTWSWNKKDVIRTSL